jgi:hypothetical protein
VPDATVLFTGTETWEGDPYNVVTVTSTITEDAPGYEGKYLFQYHVVNNSFAPLRPNPDGVSIFSVPVYDSTAISNIQDSMGWGGVATDSTPLDGGPGVVWAGSVESGSYIAPGQSADFSFTTPDTAPLATDAISGVYDDGAAEGTSGPAAAPVFASPSIKFTDGPKAGTDTGTVDMSYKWENCNRIASIQVQVVDAATGKISYYDSDSPTKQISNKKDNVHLITTAPTGTKVKVIITAKDAQGNVIKSVSDTVTVN